MMKLMRSLVTTGMAIFSIISYTQEVNWSRAFADAIIQRFPNNINDMTGKGWEYNNSIVLIGIEKMYYETGEDKYLNYIKKYVDAFINSNGDISFDPSANNLDHLHPGWLCITLYEETGEEKYKKAADNIRAEFDNQPRSASGGFWHKERYPNQMWADGIYMAEPFLIRYGTVFNDLEYAANEATKQTILIFNHAYEPSNHLIYHGWDESRTASWADPATGRSPEVWSRGMGWYMMALVDILDYLPEAHEKYDSIVTILQLLATGIEETQDPETGLWYQVVNKGDSAGNWHETSGSSMFVYALKKGIDMGYLSEDYLDVVNKGWEGIQSKITLSSSGLPVINDFVQGMGIKDDYQTYISQQKVSTPGSSYPHGYCGILLASAQMEFPLPERFSLLISSSGDGTIDQTPSGEKFDSASVVTLEAIPDAGWEFVSWTGNIESTLNPLEIQIDSNINVHASFSETGTAITTEEQSDEWVIFPSTVDREMTVILPEQIVEFQIQIVNIVGKTISDDLYSLGMNSHGQVNIRFNSNINPGIYCITIHTTNKNLSARFIKK